MPNGPRMNITHTAPSGASEQLRTDADLQIQPGPDRIDRQQHANIRGKIGPNVSAFPMTGGMEYVGHVPIVHVAQGVTQQPGGGVDDRAAIPAVFAGNPL